MNDLHTQILDRFIAASKDSSAIYNATDLAQVAEALQYYMAYAESLRRRRETEDKEWTDEMREAVFALEDQFDFELTAESETNKLTKHCVSQHLRIQELLKTEKALRDIENMIYGSVGDRKTPEQMVSDMAIFVARMYETEQDNCNLILELNHLRYGKK